VLTHASTRVSLPRDIARETADGFLAVLPGIEARLRDTVRVAAAVMAPDGAVPDVIAVADTTPETARRLEDPYLEVTA
jgi:hypothetical protein